MTSVPSRLRSPWNRHLHSHLLWPVVALSLLEILPGCHQFHVDGELQTQSSVNAGIRGSIELKTPPTHDPGPVVPMVLRPGASGGESPRVALIDVDGLLLNQNLTGLYSAGENPVASFQEKLAAAACDPRVRAVVIRINSPGGGAAATDVMAEELRKFRAVTGKPCVASLLDIATGGAYYLALGCDRIVGLPTTITGAVGAIVNHANLRDTMAMYGVKVDAVKSAELVDMGTINEPLSEEETPRKLLKEIVDSLGQRFVDRVVRLRPGLSKAHLEIVKDGRIIAAPKALEYHLIDAQGYPDDAIAIAQQLAAIQGAEVISFQREGYPTRSIYSTAPNVPLQSELIPLSLPGLDRAKLPTFLYLWQPDPTLARQGGH